MRLWTMLCAVVLLVGTALSAHAVRLAYSQQVGSSRTYLSSFTMTGNIAMPGQDSMKLDSSFSTTTEEKILAVNQDGAASVSMDMKNGNMKMTVAGQTQQMPIPAMQMTFDRTKLGKVSNMQMQGEAVDQMPGMNNMQFNQLGTSYAFPDRDLNAGDAWEDKTTLEIPFLGEATIVTKNTLVGTKIVDGKTYLQIDSTMTMTTPGTASTMGEGEQQMTMKMAIKLTGTASSLWNEEAGELFRSTVKADMIMNMTMTSADGQSMNTTMNMKMNGTMKKTAGAAAATADGPAWQ